jgi:hypothetical protein
VTRELEVLGVERGGVRLQGAKHGETARHEGVKRA